MYLFQAYGIQRRLKEIEIVGKLILSNVLFEGHYVNVYLNKYLDGKGWDIRSTHFVKEMGIEEPYAVHTVNFPGILESNEVAIKEYNEGIGSLAFLYAWDIIDKPHKLLDTEFVKGIPVCKLLINPDTVKLRTGEDILE